MKNKVIIVGNPRFDLLRPEYAIIFKHFSDKLQSKWGRYVLINTNFVAGNFNRYYRSLYLQVSKEIQGYSRRLFKFYREMVIKLSKKFPDIIFILRPHPGEDHANWKKAFKEYSNIKVLYERSAVDWIYGALVVIHNSCTTGIEAWTLDKPVLRYNPEPEKKYEMDLANKFGYNCSSVADLEILIKKALNGELKGTFNEQLSIAKPFIENVSGKFSWERIMNVFDNFYLNQQKNVINKQSLSLKDIDRVDNFRERIGSTLLYWVKLTGLAKIEFVLKILKPIITQSFQKFSGIKRNFIRYRLLQFDKIHKESVRNNVRIEKVASDTFIILNNI